MRKKYKDYTKKIPDVLRIIICLYLNPNEVYNRLSCLSKRWYHFLTKQSNSIYYIDNKIIYYNTILNLNIKGRLDDNFVLIKYWKNVYKTNIFNKYQLQYVCRLNIRHIEIHELTENINFSNIISLDLTRCMIPPTLNVILPNLLNLSIANPRYVVEEVKLPNNLESLHIHFNNITCFSFIENLINLPKSLKVVKLTDGVDFEQPSIGREPNFISFINRLNSDLVSLNISFINCPESANISLPSNLQKLQIYGSDSLSFAHLPQSLTSIHIDQSNFKMSLLTNLTNLTCLNVDSLKKINFDEFILPPKLFELKLHTKVENAFIDLQNMPNTLASLDLHCSESCKVLIPKVLPIGLKKLKISGFVGKNNIYIEMPASLTQLKLEDSKFFNFDKAPLNLSTLEIFNSTFSSRNFPLLNEILRDLDISSVDFSRKSLPNLPDNLQSFKCWGCKLTSLSKLPQNLTFLSCDYNNITYIKMPPKLIKLGCSYNKITSLKFPISLISIDCSDNKIETLGVLPHNLKILRFLNCCISVCPDFPESLLFLACSGNLFKYLPPLPSKLVSLNFTESLLETPIELPASIETLNIEMRLISELPKALKHLSCDVMPYIDNIVKYYPFPQKLDYWANKNKLHSFHNGQCEFLVLFVKCYHFLGYSDPEYFDSVESDLNFLYSTFCTGDQYFRQSCIDILINISIYKMMSFYNRDHIGLNRILNKMANYFMEVLD